MTGDILKISSEMKTNAEDVLMRIEYQNGKVERKKISIEAFYASFKEVFEKQKDTLGLRLRDLEIPAECYDLAIATNEIHTFRIALIMPREMMMPFCYKTRFQEEDSLHTFFVPMPRTLFLLNVVKGKLIKAYVFVIPEKNGLDKAYLMKYPYSNVYADGHICFGENIFTNLTVGTSVEVCKTFFSGVNNNDLFISRKIGQIDNCSLDELLKMVDGTGKMPRGLLQRYLDITVDEIVNIFMQGNM